MRVKIPADVIDLIEKHYTHGDYSDISRMIDGTDKSRQAIAKAKMYKAGDEIIVKAMIEFYRQKEIKVKEIESL